MRLSSLASRRGINAFRRRARREAAGANAGPAAEFLQPPRSAAAGGVCW